MFYLASRILHLVAHFVDLSAEMFQSYSLRMSLWGLKHVGVIQRANKIAHSSVFI